jgi:hypothetical protein
MGTIPIGDICNVEMGLVEKGPVIRSNLTYFCIFSLVINLFSTADFKHLGDQNHIDKSCYVATEGQSKMDIQMKLST